MSQDNFRISATYIQKLRMRPYLHAVVATALILAYLVFDAWTDGQNPSPTRLICFSLLIIVSGPAIFWIHKNHREGLQETQINLTPDGISRVTKTSVENIAYGEVTSATFYHDLTGRVQRIDLRSPKAWYMLTHLEGMNRLAGLLKNLLPSPDVIQVKTTRLVLTEPALVIGVALSALFALSLFVEPVTPAGSDAILSVFLIAGGLYRLRSNPVTPGQSVKERNNEAFAAILGVFLGLAYLVNNVGFWVGPCGVTGRYLLGSGCVAVYETADNVVFTPADTLLFVKRSNDIQVKAAPGWPWNGRMVLPQPEFIRGYFLSPDGNYLVTQTAESGGAQLHIWDMTSAEKVFEIYTNRIARSTAVVAFAPDSRSLAFATEDHVEVWDVTTWRQLAQFEGHSAVAYHPDGRSLAAFTSDNQVKWWQLADGAEAGTLAMPPGTDTLGEGFGLAFSPDGRWLAANSQEGMMVVWQIPAGTIHKAWQTTPATVPVTFSPDSTLLAAGIEVGDADHFHEGYIQLWTVPDYEAWDRVIIGNALSQSETDAISFSPDGRLLALTNLTGVVLYNVEKLGP